MAGQRGAGCQTAAVLLGSAWGTHQFDLGPLRSGLAPIAGSSSEVGR